MKKANLFVALDLNDPKEALHLVQKIASQGLNSIGFKIGPRLFLRTGPSIIQKIKALGPGQIFLDFKFYDIPSSSLEAVRAAFQLGADFVTIHAALGKEGLKLISEYERQALESRFFQVLPVTVLSSVSDLDKSRERSLQLAEQVFESGLSGLVCSAKEVSVLRQKYRDMFLLTPGIRLEGEGRGDQKRVMSPRQAFLEGSSALVMGRSLITAEDPIKKLKLICSSFSDLVENTDK